MRTKRVDAVVHAGMTPEEVVEILDVPLGAYVAHGNGYATVADEPEAPKRRKKATKASESDEKAPSGDETPEEVS